MTYFKVWLVLVVFSAAPLFRSLVQADGDSSQIHRYTASPEAHIMAIAPTTRDSALPASRSTAVANQTRSSTRYSSQRIVSSLSQNETTPSTTLTPTTNTVVVSVAKDMEWTRWQETVDWSTFQCDAGDSQTCFVRDKKDSPSSLFEWRLGLAKMHLESWSNDYQQQWKDSSIPHFQWLPNEPPRTMKLLHHHRLSSLPTKELPSWLVDTPQDDTTVLVLQKVRPSPTGELLLLHSTTVNIVQRVQHYKQQQDKNLPASSITLAQELSFWKTLTEHLDWITQAPSDITNSVTFVLNGQGHVRQYQIKDDDSTTVLSTTRKTHSNNNALASLHEWAHNQYQQNFVHPHTHQPYPHMDADINQSVLKNLDWSHVNCGSFKCFVPQIANQQDTIHNNNNTSIHMLGYLISAPTTIPLLEAGYQEALHYLQQPSTQNLRHAYMDNEPPRLALLSDATARRALREAHAPWDFRSSSSVRAVGMQLVKAIPQPSLWMGLWQMDDQFVIDDDDDEEDSPHSSLRQQGQEQQTQKQRRQQERQNQWIASEVAKLLEFSQQTATHDPSFWSNLAASLQPMVALVESSMDLNYDFQFLVDAQGHSWVIDWDVGVPIDAKDRTYRYFYRDQHALAQQRQPTNGQFLQALHEHAQQNRQ